MKSSNQDELRRKKIKLEFTQSIEKELEIFQVDAKNNIHFKKLELHFNLICPLSTTAFKKICDCIQGIAKNLQSFVLNLSSSTYQLREPDYAELTKFLRLMSNDSTFTLDMRGHEISEEEGFHIIKLFRQVVCVKKNLVANRFSYKNAQATDSDLNEIAIILNEQSKKIVKFAINCSDAMITNKGIINLTMLVEKMENVEELKLSFRKNIKSKKIHENGEDVLAILLAILMLDVGGNIEILEGIALVGASIMAGKIIAIGIRLGVKLATAIIRRVAILAIKALATAMAKAFFIGILCELLLEEVFNGEKGLIRLNIVTDLKNIIIAALHGALWITIGLTIVASIIIFIVLIIKAMLKNIISDQVFYNLSAAISRLKNLSSLDLDFSNKYYTGNDLTKYNIEKPFKDAIALTDKSISMLAENISELQKLKIFQMEVDGYPNKVTKKAEENLQKLNGWTYFKFKYRFEQH